MIGDKPKSISDFSSKISEGIWGHRFVDAQRGPEYILEFLNVLTGTNYDFEAESYFRKKSEKFRMFVFEGVKEGAKRSVAKLDEQDYKKLHDRIQDEKKIADIQEFFRNLEVPLVNNDGKLADRSWFAKSLFPLDESLLYFEIRKKGDSLDYERNFYARGGELYFLMIKGGTKNHFEKREFIQRRFKELLNQNKPVKYMVKNLNSILTEENNNKENERAYYLVENEKSKEIPKLPVYECELYEQFADELCNLLKINIPMYEMFKLLTSLVSFQLMRYIVFRAKDQLKNEFFFDCLDAESKAILRLSSDSFIKNENAIKDKFDASFHELFTREMNENFSPASLEEWKANTNIQGHSLLNHLRVNKLDKKKREQILSVMRTCESLEDINKKLYPVVKDMISDRLKRSQLNILKTLVRDGGMGGYRAGSKYRYYMADEFIQMLVYINVLPKDAIEFSDFLEGIYKKYGILIGEKQVKESGLYEKSSLNVHYFKKNEQALRLKLKQNGLLREYSDATAMIINPYHPKEEV